ncbi:MAG: nuclear transport factor 2 family protein [Solirubrobacterales bacterium]
MGADVEWPEAFEGGYARGTDAIRDYWHRQWTEISPMVTPSSTSVLPDGRVDVEVDQVVRNLDGELLDERIVHHVHTFDTDSIVRMDVVTS